MSFGAILLLASGLAMDAMAVAAARGMATPRVHPRHALLVALLFGGFQALMPMLGWALGSRIGPSVARWDHWIAFVLLGGIGVKMIWEARAQGGDDVPPIATAELFALKPMLILAVATSIDAFAAGITLPMMNAPFLLSMLTIGVTTAALSVIGLYAGRHFGALFGKRLDIAGGVVLIGLGTKILIEHLRAASNP